MKRLLATFTLLALLPATVAAQGNFDEVEVQSTEVGPGVHMLSGAGGNLAVCVGEDRVFLVDDQFAPLVPKIRAAVEALAPGRAVDFVLNTHFHGDHTGGNEAFGEAGSIIVAHHNVRERLTTEQVMSFFGGSNPAQPEAALPVVTFGADVSLHLGGHEVAAYHVPNAHTDGDAIVHFPGSDVLHMGDVLFNGIYPFIDIEHGGSLAGTIAACDRGLALAGEDTAIIPGHGPLASRADLQAYRDMLATVHARLEALHAEGKDADAMVAAKPTADLDEAWGKGFIPPDRWVALLATAYDDGGAGGR